MLERAWPTLISLFIFRFQRSKFIIRAVPSICDVADARKINLSFSGPIHVARKSNRAFQTSIIRVDSIQIAYLVFLYSDLWGIFWLLSNSWTWEEKKTSEHLVAYEDLAQTIWMSCNHRMHHGIFYTGSMYKVIVKSSLGSVGKLR